MWWWIAAGILVVILVPVAIVVVPILTHVNQGSSGQADSGDDWPTSVTATGDDGRTRTLSVAADAGALDTSSLAPGERIVVTGSGFDANQGIYGAICVVTPATA
jgi:hypothetical protein